MYAVIDTETTGASPNDDRIIELAVIGLSPAGETEWEWCSLINPERDTGSGLARQVHQIYPDDVKDAPLFQDLAGEVAKMLEVRAIIAHNARFDLGMLGAEFRRLGFSIPAVPQICTATIAREAGFRPYRLNACCDAMCIDMDGMHHALADARSTARLALRLLDFSDPSMRQNVESSLRESPLWPKLAVSGAQPLTRRMLPVRKKTAGSSGPAESAKKAVERVASKLTPPVIETFSLEENIVDSQYLSAVERVLEDREISEEQQKMLVGLRAKLGLTPAQAREVHVTFVRGLAGSMWDDDVISDHEQFDLALVGELLQLSAEDVEYARNHPIRLGLVNEEYDLKAGDRVVFTGEMSIPRPEWKHCAEELGLRVTGSVSKLTNCLVVPFGQTGSGKSLKARKPGVRVVSEQRFKRMTQALKAND